MTTFAATLPLPPSINRTYKTTRLGGFYTDPRVKAWKSDALLALTLAGWKRQPPGNYSITVDYDLKCARNRDVDSVSKLLIDTTVGEALGLNDKSVDTLFATKTVEPKRAQQRVTVKVTVTPLADQE